MKIRIVVLGLVVLCAALVDASHGQIFQRLRRNLGGRSPQQLNPGGQLPQIQQQPQFDTRTWQYTQPRPPVTYVPSAASQQAARAQQAARIQQARIQQGLAQQGLAQQQAPNGFTAYRYADGRVVLVPRTQRGQLAVQPTQQRIQQPLVQGQQFAQAQPLAQTATGQQRIRVVTYYDQNTGRYFQRRFLLGPATGTAGVAPAIADKATTSAGQGVQVVLGPPAKPADSGDVSLLPLDESPAVGQASFNSDEPAAATKTPDVAKADLIPAEPEKETSDTFSVLEVEEGNGELEQPPSSQDPGSLDESLFELDLPALNGPGEKGK